MTKTAQSTKFQSDIAKVAETLQVKNVRDLRKMASGKVKNASRLSKDSLVAELAKLEAIEISLAVDEMDAKAAKPKTQTKSQAKRRTARTGHESDVKKVGPVRFSAGTKAQQAAKATRGDDGKVRGNRCQVCGNRPIDRKTQGRDSTMCAPCFDYAGWENTHSDERHETYRNTTGLKIDAAFERELNECPVCQGNNPADVSAKKNGSKVGRTVSKPAKPEGTGFDAKAKAFATIAKSAGWTGKVRQVTKTTAQVIATAKDGRSITMTWNAGAYDYDASQYKDGKHSAKIRNASAARRMLEA